MTGIECQLQRLGEFDLSGRRRPVPIEESEFEESQFVLDADILIAAIGQASDLEGLKGEEELSFDQRGALTVGDNLCHHPGRGLCGRGFGPGAGHGDRGGGPGKPSGGRRGCLSEGDPVERPKFIAPYHEVEQAVNLEDYAEARPPVIRRLSKEERIGNFLEVEAGLDEWAAREEAKRCLRCDLEWLHSRGRDSGLSEKK